MGKNKTSSKAAAKAAKKVKASEKQAKRETKNVKKTKTAPEDDLEAILDEAHKVTEETDTGPPSRRANSTLTGQVSNRLIAFDW
ncbi:hypothetical protein FRC10_003713 [Ceratobasidium sp. 414]|nr:hypothetical protein FRC10_003713 [Ceratobasidium sp. 414]